MSKQLKSILDKLPHATASSQSSTSFSEPEKSKDDLEKRAEEKMSRIVASVPSSLKKDLRKYILENPRETEKSLILRGLRALGFSVLDEYIEDKRRKN